MKSTDVLISGAGIPGLTLGILLAKVGFDVTICDPHPLPDVKEIALSGRTAALMENSLAILDAAEIFSSVENISEDLKVLSIMDGDFRSDFKSSEIGLQRFGKNIQNSILHAHAARIFKTYKNARFIQDKLAHIEISGSTALVEFSQGEERTANLVVGADGRGSFVREWAKIDLWQHDYQQMALTGLVAHTKPHKQTSIEFHLPGGPFTFVPFKDNEKRHISSFVWMEKTRDAQDIVKLPNAEIEQRMARNSQDIYGEIELLTEIVAYPIKIKKTKNLISDRIALIAEAAHVLSPIGAQGLNLSLRDAAVLASTILNAARLGLDYGSHSVLKSYENARLADINLRVKGTDLLNRSVVSRDPLFSSLRRLGFQAAKNIVPLRALLIQEALAPAIDSNQDILSDFTTRATVKTSTRSAPAS